MTETSDNESGVCAAAEMIRAGRSEAQVVAPQVRQRVRPIALAATGEAITTGSMRRGE
jgi:hypothetical protein